MILPKIYDVVQWLPHEEASKYFTIMHSDIYYIYIYILILENNF